MVRQGIDFGIDFTFPRGQLSIEGVDDQLVQGRLGEEKIERSLGLVGAQGAFRSHALLVGDNVFLVRHWPQSDEADDPRSLEAVEEERRSWHGPVTESEIIHI